MRKKRRKERKESSIECRTRRMKEKIFRWMDERNEKIKDKPD